MADNQQPQDLTDHNDFDHCARDRGWNYDNCWPFNDETWESYGGPGP